MPRSQGCVYAAICAMAFTARAAPAPLSPNRHGQLARPNLRFACELESSALVAMLSEPAVISDLADLGAGVSLAISDMTQQRAYVVRRLNQASIPVTAWLLLPKEQGYFLNAGNASVAMARFDELEAWSAAYGLRWAGIGLDIEPDIEELQKLAHGGVLRLIPALIRRGFDHQRIRTAKEEYQRLIARMHGRGYPVEVYQLFFMADERKARSTLLERLLAVVDVSGDRECLMLYTSFHHSWGDSAIWAYGAEAGTIVIGSTGGDSKLDAGFAPLNWDEFIRDLRAARYWTNDIGVYSLEGCVRQGLLGRLKAVDWGQQTAPLPPSSGLGRVRAIRAGIAVVLWVDRYAYAILACLLGVGWLGARTMSRRRSKMRTVASLETRSYEGKRAFEPESASKLLDNLIRRHPAVSYFVLAYSISWLGGLAVTAPYWMHGEVVPKMSGLMMFPAMLLGPSVAGVALRGATQGRAGLRNLLSRMRRIGSYRWLAALAIPLGLVLGVLFGLKTFVSPAFAPNHFWIGFSFGCAAGFFEEIGWTGFAFPTMRLRWGGLAAAISLGLLWAVWHIPVIDYLGSATPHGRYWLPFFLAFTAAMTAMRVLICWVYSNTNSVLLAQMLHASSTGALAAFSPTRVTAGEEALWYAVYASVLWTIVAAIVARYGTTLANDRSRLIPS